MPGCRMIRSTQSAELFLRDGGGGVDGVADGGTVGQYGEQVFDHSRV